MWFSNPYIGSISALVDKHRTLVGLQKDVPLANALILLFICCIFLWLRMATRTNDPIYRDFIFALISNTMFYLFLAGVDLQISPYWGSIFHFPLSTIASLSIFRLVSNFGNMEKKIVSGFTVIYYILGTVQLIAALLGLVNVELL